MNEEQLEDILQEQEDSYISFGEALVQIGAMSEEEVMEQLKEFTWLRMHRYKQK